MFRFTVKELLYNAGVHGFRFVVLPKRTLLEKVIWGILVTTSLVAVVCVCLFAWQNLNSSIVLTLVDSTYYPLWNIPFPAVTVCNFNKISKRKAYEMATQLKQTGDMPIDELASHLRYLILLVQEQDTEVSYRRLLTIQDILERNNYTAEQVFQMITPSCGDMLKRCVWKGDETRCEAIFEQIATSTGYCCSFNYYGIKNHRFSGYLARKSPLIPRRLSACGYSVGLEMVVDNDLNDYFANPHFAVGYTVKVHYPYTVVGRNMPDTWIQPNAVAFISITPQASECSGHVKWLPMEMRKCVLDHEIEMATFERYTYGNCMAECRMELIYRVCGCTPFYYYNENGTQKVNRICNLRDVPCIASNKHLIWSSIPGYGPTVPAIKPGDKILGLDKGECDCLPDCEEARYSMEPVTGWLSRNFSYNKKVLYDSLDITNHSSIRIFPSDLIVTRTKRFLRYHWHNFFALFGGLVGLFTGMTFISAFEIVYYLTIRQLTNVMRRHRHELPALG